ncbi:hypothetical protein J2B92_17190 [Lysinibacillus sphaericus]|uniref:hypothetical protein n=2 Tax=Lysinibacillus sphaericus TaxID=1421 RepID=UPI0018CCBC57|nr:hypothetical protein [Lysinibacillus sphaericus]MBG9756398.1 hypothetical protein [Lysinibacillus sphaericus]QTB12576.1 hypothetical protein J2B92_17190 [Lysinibacillus sphaericus]
MTIKVSENASTEQVGDAIKKAKGNALGEQANNTIKTEKNEQLIYVGPPVKGVQRFSVFKGGYPKNLEEHLEKCTAFKQLFVPIQELTTVQMRLNDSSTVESMFYNKVIEYFKGVK